MTATKHYLMALVFVLVPTCGPVLSHQAPAHPRQHQQPATHQAPRHPPLPR